jgi:large subunit ribosomal protein L18
MDNSKKKRKISRHRRQMRVRKAVRGDAVKPRLTVSKTNCHVYAQIIDDEKAVTIVGAGTQAKANQNTAFNKKSKEAAYEIGKQIGELAKKNNINTVVFDRGRYKFHGVIAELAKGAREAGLQF